MILKKEGVSQVLQRPGWCTNRSVTSIFVIRSPFLLHLFSKLNRTLAIPCIKTFTMTILMLVNDITRKNKSISIPTYLLVFQNSEIASKYQFNQFYINKILDRCNKNDDLIMNINIANYFSDGIFDYDP